MKLAGANETSCCEGNGPAQLSIYARRVALGSMTFILQQQQQQYLAVRLATDERQHAARHLTALQVSIYTKQQHICIRTIIYECMYPFLYCFYVYLFNFCF